MPVANLTQSNKKICALHFEDNQFHDKEKRSRLLWNAVPTIKNEHELCQTVSHHGSVGMYVLNYLHIL